MIRQPDGFGEGSMMDSILAFMNGEAARAAGNPMRQLDWDKAKEICEQHKGSYIRAGLQYDMEWTGGCIYDGENYITDDYVCVASTWATPIVEVDGKDIECWKYGVDSNMPKWWGRDTND